MDKIRGARYFTLRPAIFPVEDGILFLRAAISFSMLVMGVKMGEFNATNGRQMDEKARSLDRWSVPIQIQFICGIMLKGNFTTESARQNDA